MSGSRVVAFGAMGENAISPSDGPTMAAPGSTDLTAW